MTTLWLTGVLLSMGEPALSRPAAPRPSELRPPGSFFRPARDAERANRRIYEAQFRLSVLQSLEEVDAELLALGDRVLRASQSQQQSGQFFNAAETAKAAERIYEAAFNLYEAKTGRLADTTGGGVTKSYYDAPYRVGEELARTEADAIYYRSADRTVSDLLGLARQTAQPFGITAPLPRDFAVLARNRGAIQMLKAARHLMRAERGF